jgi:hypothetical protein
LQQLPGPLDRAPQLQLDAARAEAGSQLARGVGLMGKNV